MAEQIKNKKVFSLLEVNRSIQKTLRQRYSSSFWVKAEMMKLNHYPHSGHCYPDLVEKREGKVVAQVRSILWRTDFERVNRRFIEILKEPLKDGIKILFLARINYDPLYGLSLQIMDIDPSFTLGDMEQEKQEAIAALKREKLFLKNKSLSLPLLPQRIAVISVETSKGFADFRKVIDSNDFGYAFFYYLFPSMLQGDQAVHSIRTALDRIERVRAHFDLVAIIRGGGGEVGLSCYNDLELSKRIATFPLPVVTGIGHSTNETVVEMIAFENCITPTKMAEWLLQKFHNFAVPLQDAEEKIISYSKDFLKTQKTAFENQIRYFKATVQNNLTQNGLILSKMERSIGQQASFLLKTNRSALLEQQIDLRRNCFHFLKNKEINLTHYEKQVQILDPVQVLKRGFSITSFNNKSLKNADEVKEGMEITTALFQGTLTSKITHIEKEESHE